jgi:hypothetical protein
LIKSHGITRKHFRQRSLPDKFILIMYPDARDSFATHGKKGHVVVSTFKGKSRNPHMALLLTGRGQDHNPRESTTWEVRVSVSASRLVEKNNVETGTVSRRQVDIVFRIRTEQRATQLEHVVAGSQSRPIAPRNLRSMCVIPLTEADHAVEVGRDRCPR